MAKLSQEFINSLAQPIVDVYNQLEHDLIVNIAKRFNTNMGLTTTEWQTKKLAELGALTKENAKIIADAVGQVPELTQIAFESAAWESLKTVEPTFAAAVKAGYIDGASQPLSDSIAQALKAYQGQAKDAFNLVNTTMLRSSATVYSKAVNGIAMTEKQAATAQGILNTAAGSVATGIETRQAAVRDAITKLADQGITAFTDRIGRNWSAEAYVNMDVRTTVNNVANQAVMNRAEDYGTDVFEISSHAGARPKCALDQGKLVSKDNASGYVKDVYGNKLRYIPLSQTSYGEPDGILGINCGHHLSPIIPGHFVKRSEETQDYEENAEKYKESQEQRKLEREVRKDKTTADALKASGDTEGYEKAALKLKNDNQALKNYCAETGRTYRADRTQVLGWSKTQAASASTAANDYYNKVVRQNLPKKATLADKLLQNTTKGVTITLQKDSAITNVRTIAGYGVKTAINDINRLVNTYGGDAYKWQKNVGTIVMDGEKYEVHWYEYNGKQYENKIKVNNG
jgi:hypothetical protein